MSWAKGIGGGSGGGSGEWRRPLAGVRRRAGGRLQLLCRCIHFAGRTRLVGA